MGYTVELEAHDLRCKSEEDAWKAADIIAADGWICPYHLQVVAREDDGAWSLSIEHFQGDHWRDDRAREVWAALAPHMADGATIELQGEGRERWRIRWQSGAVFEQNAREVLWITTEQITPPLKEEAS